MLLAPARPSVNVLAQTSDYHGYTKMACVIFFFYFGSWEFHQLSSSLSVCLALCCGKCLSSWVSLFLVPSLSPSLFSEEPCLLSGSGMNLGGLSELFSQLRRRGCVKASASWQERGAISPDKAMADLRIVTKQTAWMQVGTRQCTCISLQPKIQAR